MNSPGVKQLRDWIHRENYDGRYAVFSEILCSIDEESWFWSRYEHLFSTMAVHKRALTHYLFTASVQYTVARTRDSELAIYFPASPTYDASLSGRSAVNSFIEFCQLHWNSIESVASSRTVQINKLGRNALMAMLLLEAQRRVGEPAVFVEAGSSVGLGLLWPWMAARYSTGSVIEGCFFEGDQICDCRIAGVPALLLHGTGPNPVRVIGIEIDSLDSNSQDDVDWLRALVAPNDAFGRIELNKGLALLRSHRPEILQGCVLDRLGDVVAEMPGGQPLVVYHCMTLHHLIEAGKLDAWHRLLRFVARSRPVIEAYVAWEEGEPSATPWPVEIRIREWHRERPRSELIGWSDPSADGTSISFRSVVP